MEERRYYIDSKGQKRRIKYRLLALYNERVSSAYGYCKLKECYLTRDNVCEKKCLQKGKPGDYCSHLYILEGKEITHGVPRAKMKPFKGRRENDVG